ncbi:MAG: hypothetical protein NC302_06825 [Bacteroidales bacterium]|nr:hypothetical protein [Bacteroidales bacterium]MCM1416225.1 hypothetical protein [bacterium]MCM1423346.1 hypothetical protein [bacterium]
MRYKIVGVCLFLALLLTACGKDEELDAYLEDMNTFFSRAAQYNENMNAIDRDSDTAMLELLGYLDALKEDIAWMAKLEVPEQFSAAESLADEAAENMDQAVALFHQAYDGDTFDDAAAQAAIEYYNRTNIRIQYIITILHGEIPEGEGVTYTEENNNFFGGGYLNKQGEDADGEEDGMSSDGAEEMPEDDFDTDDTVFYVDPSEETGE